MAQRETWSALECEVALYEEDGSGGYNSTPTRECQCVQNGSFKALFEQGRTGETGKATKTGHSVQDGWEISIGEFYMKRSEQIGAVSDPTKRWRINILNVNPTYASADNDSHVFRMAHCTDCSVAWQDNDIQAFSMTFWAEEMED
jgi:hypothetical protein